MRVARLLWPRGGWGRAFQYARHRVNRLPDSPERIARGIWAGVFTAFTPFYGMHFILAAVIAYILRGNILAATIATFFGNPLTYVPIGVIALQTGHWILGAEWNPAQTSGFGRAFVDAGRDLTHNFFAMFDEQTPEWAGLIKFYHEVFLPYLVGGILPGIVAATICYYLSAPLIRAYQARRKGAIKARIAAMKAKTALKAKQAAKSAERHPGE